MAGAQVQTNRVGDKSPCRAWSLITFSNLSSCQWQWAIKKVLEGNHHVTRHVYFRRRKLKIMPTRQTSLQPSNHQPLDTRSRVTPTEAALPQTGVKSTAPNGARGESFRHLSLVHQKVSSRAKLSGFLETKSLRGWRLVA